MRFKRHRFYPIIPGYDDVGNSRNLNKTYRSFRLRSGWTGKERDKYKPGAHHCPECGEVLRQGDGDFVVCEGCGDTFDCDWSDYQPGVGPRS